MRRPGSLFIASCALLALFLSPGEPRDRSAVIEATADRVIVANPDSSSITVIDALARAKIREIEVACTPQTLTVLADRVFVACRDRRVVVTGIEDGGIAARSSIGVEPFGIVSDGARLFVSDYGASMIRVLDVDTLQPLATIATESHPRGLALEGATLYVTHFRTGRITVIDTDSLEVTRVIATEADGNLAQVIVVHEGRAYVPQTRANASNPALLFHTTVFPVVSVVDLATGANVPRDRFSIDALDKPVNMPIDAAITASGKLIVLHAGSDDLSVIDIATRKLLAHIEVGTNPRGVALSPDESLAWVSNALEGTVTLIDTSTNAVIATIEATAIPLPPNLLNGKILFHTTQPTTMARDQWISCATCHFEGGADGRTWFFRDGPRNTPALFGVLSTLPMHWSGDLDELQDVEQTIRIVQAGTGLAHVEDICMPACDSAPRITGSSRDLDDLAAFMAHLQAPRRLPISSDAVDRGRSLFSANGCVSCHPAPLFTDRRKHDVNTGGPLERKGNAFDTPSLRGLFDTAPYFHDGSALTLFDVLARHGDTAHMSAEERQDLVAFLLSIPFPEGRRRVVRH